MRMMLAGAAALVMAAAMSAPVAAQDVTIALAPGETLLKVEAEGVSRNQPDLMEITAGVVTTGSSAREALRANSALAERLIAAVRAAGIDPRDVRTAELSVAPRLRESDDDNVRPRILGYVARNSLELRLRDLARASEVIDALFAAGANQVDGPRFALADAKPALREARRAAIAEARAEAETYAEALNMRIARVLRVSERNPMNDGNGSDTIVVTGSRVRGAPIEPGEIDTEVTVWADYALAPR